MSDSFLPFLLIVIVVVGFLAFGDIEVTPFPIIGIPISSNAGKDQQTLQIQNIPFITASPTPTPVVTNPITPSVTTAPSTDITPIPTTSSPGNLASWPVFNLDGQRSGINTSETALTAQTVKNLKQLWKTKLPNTADSTPVALKNVQTASGTKDLTFVTTLNGSLIALNIADGTIVWQKNGSGGGTKITNSSPALDPSGQYVYGYNLDGKVHKYDVATGNEITTGGWPETGTLLPNDEKESSSLNIDNGYLYVTFSGYSGDANHYEGHVDAINLATGVKTVWNSLCSNIHQQLDRNSCGVVQSGIWARAGAVADHITNTVYVVTGNGAFDANNGGNNYGDSIISLKPDLSQIVDTYTPNNYASLQSNDADLGSTAPVLIPQQTNSTTPYMALQGGKDNTLRLVNRQNMSGNNTPNRVGGELQSVRMGCELFSQPLAWKDATGVTWIFVSSGCGLDAYKVVNAGKSTIQRVYQGAGGSSPVMANNILYIQSGNAIQALDPTTGNALWTGATNGLHWESPIVFNGIVLVPDNAGNITAFGL